MNEVDIFCQKILYKEYSFDLSKLLINIIKKEKKQVSNIGGDQFSVFVNYKNFLNVLEEEANKLAKIIGCEKVFLDNIWLNVNRNKDYNMLHDHPNSVVSGIFYVKVPENSGELIFSNENLIRFYPLKIKEYNKYNSQIWKFEPKENTLYLFPSWIKHMVSSNFTNEERISLAFNFR